MELQLTLIASGVAPELASAISDRVAILQSQLSAMTAERDALRKLVDAPVPAQPVATVAQVPEGFVLVPRDPTGEMVTAGANVVSDDYDDGKDQRHREIARFAYRRMLAASPAAKPEDAT